jgi:hypothetical protein
MTLRDRLLAGEHRGCASWVEVARKLKVDERHLRVVRKTLASEGKAVDLAGPRDPDLRTYIVDTANKMCRGCSDCAMGGSGSTCVPGNYPAREEPRSTAKNRPDRESRWSTVAAFDRGELDDDEPRIWQASDFRNPDALPYTPPISPKLRKLTRDECPDGTMILWASDIHIPIHHEMSCRLMVECAERVGVKRAVIGGDGLDMNCLSKHAKESERVVQHATILEEVEPGRWLLDYFASLDTDYMLGNHEGRLKRFVDENPAFHGSLASNFAKICELPTRLNVVPQGGEVRLGNLAFVHGDAEFKNGTGGQYPAARLLQMLPDQSTICGHLHRMAQACRTTRDEDGIPRTRRAWTMGHMSIEEMHYGYVSKNPNWQMGFALIRVFWEGDRPRWTVYPIEILFDRYNRPYFEFGGHVYSAARKVAA